MRVPLAIALTALLTLSGCGDSDAAKAPRAGEDMVSSQRDKAATQDSVNASKTGGTKVVLAKSEFGKMLFDSRRQAIYIFERDRKNRSNCYGECAVAWPPVLAKGKPRAGTGVKAALLGMIERRNGKRQVTYAGKPLYYYAHEGPGEVECHNVSLNGGFWWVVGANGKRRP